VAYEIEARLYGNMQIPPLKQTLKELETEYRDHLIIKAAIDDVIIGSVRGTAHEGTCLISKLSVHPEHQNRGIGKSLMEFIEEEFNGCTRFELFTGHKSLKNIKLYERLGYEIFKTEFINEQLSLVYMEKVKE
jgi:ribosomal protein S18 acetylase RimI-like enzyme